MLMFHIAPHECEIRSKSHAATGGAHDLAPMPPSIQMTQTIRNMTRKIMTATGSLTACYLAVIRYRGPIGLRDSASMINWRNPISDLAKALILR